MSFNVNNSLYSLPRFQAASDWVRPSDWLPITDTDNQVQALVNDTGQGWISFTTTFAAGAGVTCSVDWGDGTISQSTTSPFRADHYYTPGTGATCSRGYTTFNVKIYIEDNATPITSCRFTDVGGSGATASNGSALTFAYSVGLLEMYYGRYTQQNTGMGGYFSANDTSGGSGFFCANFNQLEYVKMPPTMSVATLYQCFEGCINLYKVDMPESIVGSDSIGSMFLNCYNLQTVDFPQGLSHSITYMDNAFSNCYNLRSVTLPPTLNGLLTLAGAFNNCYSLQSIDMPPMPLCTSYSTAFQNCFNLRTFRFKTLLTTGNSITFQNMFAGCRSLENVTFPPTWDRAYYITNMSAQAMFSNCSNLIDVVIPVFSIGNMTTMFSGCSLLQSVRFLLGLSSGAITFSQTFNNCYSLQTVDFPVLSIGGSSTAVMSNTFLNCADISFVKIPFDSQSLSGCFNGCQNLVSVDITACSSVTTMDNAFSNCTQLKSVLFPTAMNVLTNFTSCFIGCTALEEITLPNTLLVTLYSTMFSGCRSLRKITFGTFGSGLTGVGWQAMFTSCGSLLEIDLSFLNGYTLANSTLTTNFQGCNALKKITFPTTQWTAFTAPSNQAFGSCANLTTIVNFDKVGPTGVGTIINWGTNLPFGSGNTGTTQLLGLTFSTRNAQIIMAGTTTLRWNLQNLRLLNANTGQWTGTSPQVNVSYTSLGYAALVQLFNDIAASGTYTAKTINITSCPGAASLTAADRLILTSKGWTITG